MTRPSQLYEEYIPLSKYARWLPKEEKRETWDETVDRYCDFMSVPKDIRKAIKEKQVMPSMRAMMTAGPALARCNTVGYNCAGIGVDHPRVFDEIFYILMGGSGVGFSVERRYIEKLPVVAEEFHDTDTTIVVKDSRAGWAKSLKELISLLYSGDVPKCDISAVRAAGSRLNTMGGRASGPDPLIRLFNYCIRLFKGAAGRPLTSLEAHDLCCTIADVVIMGSVRRSACISFSNLTDSRMAGAKSGNWYNSEVIDHPTNCRALANNSTMFTSKPDVDAFSKEFRNLYRSKSGERGIVNQQALQKKADLNGRLEDFKGQFLLNPCGEAILRDTGGFCNLTEVIVRPEDTLEDLERKVKQATILGTKQAALTDFKYLRKVWKKNAEEERLLGISFTGIMDNIMMSSEATTTDCLKFAGDFRMEVKPDPDLPVHRYAPQLEEVLQHLKKVAVDTNIRWAKKLGILPSKQLTLVKPSGTVSSLVGTSSGIHPRYAPYYIRRATQDHKDPLTQMMKDVGIPYSEDERKVYFEFPIKSPGGSVTRGMMTPIDQLRLWKIYSEHWCDGNPSQTIYYNDDTFLDVQAWVYKNWDDIGGLSFFPSDDNVYTNQPFEEIDSAEYDRRVAEFPKGVDWTLLSKYEKDDEAITANQELACSGGSCEI